MTMRSQTKCVLLCLVFSLLLSAITARPTEDDTVASSTASLTDGVFNQRGRLYDHSLHSSTGLSVDPAFDCGMAQYAIQRATEIQPGISNQHLQQIADALNGRPEALCRNVTVKGALRGYVRPVKPMTQSVRETGKVVVVDAAYGDDSNDGTVESPMQSIQAAIVAARPHGTVKLRAGVYMEGATIQIVEADSGLTLTNWPGEEVVISGGKRLDTTWKPYHVVEADTHRNTAAAATCTMKEDPVNLIREGGDIEVVPMKTTNISECIAACCAYDGCWAASFNINGDGCGKSPQCCHLKRYAAVPTPNKYGPNVRTVYNPDAPPPPPSPSPPPPPTPIPANIYVTDVPEGFGDITGLRLNDKRAIRARYPNANPETAGMHTVPTGWITQKTTWVPPVKMLPPQEIEVTDPRWRRHDVADGNELGYQGGVGVPGSPCAHLDPPFGYWCSNHPNRTASGALTHRWPAGVVHGDGKLLPNAGPSGYKTPRGAILHSCRGGANCWFTWMFEVDDQPDNDTLKWTKGGFQGAEGSDDGGVWYIENVMEELDWPTEYFYDKANGKLYFFQNASVAKTPPTTGFVSAEVKVLVNVSGSQAAPVKDVTISGITFRDAASTFMDPHGMPSGGDWCLQKSGAITLKGTEGTTLTNLTITRVDGNAVFMGAYNRNASVLQSEFVWIGDSAIALWGETEALAGGQPQPSGTGINGTGGNQPRFTTISGNIIHEIGHYQKQSSMVFQAQSCQSTITNNIFYNGPRAHVNFNDQFGGANLVADNLIFNSCRETADHGPFNSWGRQPYITKVRDGKTESITPAFTEITRNFIISNYHGHEAIDNDDMSEYFHTHHNFFVYGANGLKSDFAGHDNVHWSNLYAYVAGNGFGVGAFLPGHQDGFFNNTLVASGGYGGFSCSTPQKPTLHDNKLYIPKPAELCGQTLAQWQAKGYDLGTTQSTTPPSAADLLALARQTIASN